MKVLRLTPNDDLEKNINALTEPATVYLAAGAYRQKVEIRANNITLIGESREATVILTTTMRRKFTPTARNTTLSAHIRYVFRARARGLKT